MVQLILMKGIPTRADLFRTLQVGKDLGKTTGWIHRATLQRRGVQFINGVSSNKPAGIFFFFFFIRFFFCQV